MCSLGSCTSCVELIIQSWSFVLSYIWLKGTTLCFPCQKIPYTFACWASYFLVIDCSLRFIECCILDFYSLIYSNFSHLLMVMISVTQDETGVYKNLLQEVAQRVGAPLPLYTTERSGLGHLPVFTCTVELAGFTSYGVPANKEL